MLYSDKMERKVRERGRRERENKREEKRLYLREEKMKHD